MSTPSKRVNRRKWLLVIVALTMGLALHLGGNRSAFAANPTLSVSPNPVVVLNNGAPDTATTTISWNLNGTSSARLIIDENPVSGLPLVDQPLSAQTGSMQFTVTYGKSYTAELRQALLGPVYDSEQITTQRPTVIMPPGGSAGCAIVTLCITDVNVTRHGTFAEFFPTANKAAAWTVDVSTSAVDTKGTATKVDDTFPSGATVRTGFLLGYTAQPASPVTVFLLQPNTTYNYILRATAQDGDKAAKTGTFTTLTRRVEVTFTQIYMIDDADALTACDCIFWFRAGNASEKQYGDGSDGVATGTNLYLNPDVKITVDDAPDSLQLRVEAFDIDCDWYMCYPFCLYLEHPNWSTGSEWTCGDWHTAYHAIATVPGSPGAEAFTQSFQFQTLSTSNPPLFRTYGTFKVSYH